VGARCWLNSQLATSHFPQLADGGTDAQHWTTTLTIVDTNPASTPINLYGDNGNPLPLDFDNAELVKVGV
jgi:hypothetical protein